MLTTEHLALITRKARAVAVLWPDVDADDLQQELCVKWLESWRACEVNPMHAGVRTYLEDSDTDRGARKLDKTLTRWAHAWCRQETTAIRGHDDFARYTRKQILDMLPSIEKPEAWSSLAAPGSGGGKSTKPASEGGDTLAAYGDLRSAWGHLSADERTLLRWRYVDLDPDWLERASERWGGTEAALRKRCSRAVDRIERFLAGKSLREGHEGRKTLTNAAAQSITNRNYG